ncbi:MAG: hypothetical protein WBP41_02375 [Saprospiraceae bacterium]
MVFEIGAWTIAKILIKATKKFSKDIIKKRFNLSDKQMELLYGSIDSPEKLGEFVSTFYGKTEKIEEIETTIEVLNKENNNNIDLQLLIPHSKLEIYFDIIEEIFYIAKIVKQPLILNGFFNGEEFISYFSFDNDSKSPFFKSINSINFGMGCHIYIERVKDSEKRLNKIRSQRDKIKYAKFKSLHSLNTTSMMKVTAIHDTFIEIKEKGFNPLEDNKTVKEQFTIKEDYKGIILLRKSLDEFVVSLINDMKFLRSISE